MTRHPLAALLLLLGGCVSETERVLRTWEGVYRFTRTTENSEDCAVEGPETTPEHPFFELDSAEGIDAHLVELRPCASASSCESTGFLTWLAPKASPTRLDGTRDEVFYTVVGDQGGLCQAVHEELEVRRASADARELSIVVFSAIATDVLAPTQEDCVDLLGLMAEDPDGCDTLKVFEGRRVD